MNSKYEAAQFFEESHKSGKILLKGGLLASLDPKEMQAFLVRFFYERVRRQPYWLFIYDRIEDINDSWGFTVARLELKPDDKKYTIEVRKREEFVMPSELDLQIFEEFRRLCKLDQEICDHANKDDNRYSASDESSRKRKALAGDKFGVAYEQAEESVMRALSFLYLTGLYRFEVSI